MSRSQGAGNVIVEYPTGVEVFLDARRGWDRRALVQVAVKDVLAVWREFLNTAAIACELHYRVYHAGFRGFLAGEIGLTGYRVTVRETALAMISGFYEDA